MKVQFIVDITPEQLAVLRRAKRGGVDQTKGALNKLFEELCQDPKQRDALLRGFAANI